jgi:hypothetical protein
MGAQERAAIGVFQVSHENSEPTMKRLTILVIALLALSVQAALAAPPEGKGKSDNPGKSTAAPGQADDKNAAKTCKAERARIGVTAFKAKYGTNPNKANAFGKCVSAQEKQQEAEELEEARENAAKACKKLRADMGLEEFREEYGTNANGANAFGKCVSKLAKKQLES